MKTSQEILDSKDLHLTYPPGGDHSVPRLHDSDCTFCHREEKVLEAMEEFSQQITREDIMSFGAGLYPNYQDVTHPDHNSYLAFAEGAFYYKNKLSLLSI